MCLDVCFLCVSCGVGVYRVVWMYVLVCFLVVVGLYVLVFDVCVLYASWGVLVCIGRF